MGQPSININMGTDVLGPVVHLETLTFAIHDPLLILYMLLCLQALLIMLDIRCCAVYKSKRMAVSFRAVWPGRRLLDVLEINGYVFHGEGLHQTYKHLLQDRGG